MPDKQGFVCVPRNDPFDLNDEWLKKAEVEVCENCAQARSNLDKLRILLQSVPDLNPRTDDPFLLSFLRARKHDVEKALKMVLQYYEMRLKYPKYYETTLPSEKWFVYSKVTHTILENRDSEGRSILILKGGNMDPSILEPEQIVSALATSVQFLTEDPKTQVAGLILLIDLAGFTLSHMRLITPRNVYVVLNALQDTFPVRTRAIHIVNTPFFFEALYNCFKPFLKEKLRKRIKIHGKNFKSLHAFVEPKVLPKEYGGEQPPVNNRSLCHQLTQNEQMIKEWAKFRYKKSK
ncbi:unnamed protein product [Bemisia tabaci]|uniref:CRAL-TRIO domain-containing protein n=1 Tax=Bemisia tabaci TaxID=7038 RepID=A0A9P0G2M2_BEMTA|nr:PREDICTED: clavesin-2-like [Bemisia tabaci]CAH0752711.1 unnamed protein product [Bemisia tabaci]